MSQTCAKHEEFEFNKARLSNVQVHWPSIKFHPSPFCYSLLPLRRNIQTFLRVDNRTSAVLRKNVVWASKRCQISFNESRIFGEIWERLSSNISDNFVRNFIQNSWKSQRKISIAFFKNKHFIEGNLATLECSHSVFP